MIALHKGDCLPILRDLAARGQRFQACVTDPPYHLTSIVKRFGKPDAVPAQHGHDGAFARASRGFMGQTWDGGDVAFRPETWATIAAALVPGSHIAAFGGTRTFHRMAVAMEDAGLEIRDTLMWLYATGFPKSHNLDGEWDGWGTALKPAWEPIILARVPLDGTVAANVAAHGAGAINVDGCRVPVQGARRAISNSESASGLSGIGGAVTYGSFAVRGSVAAGETSEGRWPANVLHDGSDEVEAAFAAFGTRSSGKPGVMRKGRNDGACLGAESRPPGTAMTGHGDSGSASRFFYSSKAGAQDRAGSRHPTVKPVSLMRWLVRLVTPPGGVVLDPFAGSGTTGEAAAREGFRSALIEREPAYQADIERRIEAQRAEAGLFAAE